MINGMDDIVNEMKKAARPVSSFVSNIEFGLREQIKLGHITVEELAGICERLSETEKKDS